MGDLYIQNSYLPFVIVVGEETRSVTPSLVGFYFTLEGLLQPQLFKNLLCGVVVGAPTCILAEFLPSSHYSVEPLMCSCCWLEFELQSDRVVEVSLKLNFS